ncbi:MAG: HPr family phosphocarrier protein [Clostridiales bacterium]|nr:HPr family phosphocarrier protein [Clostridiales bacterium]
MRSFDFTITDEVGIDANPAVSIGKLAKEFPDSVVVLRNGDKEAQATMLMALIDLCVKCGDRITVEVKGGDEEQTANAFEAFFKENL